MSLQYIKYLRKFYISQIYSKCNNKTEIRLCLVEFYCVSILKFIININFSHFCFFHQEDIKPYLNSIRSVVICYPDKLFVTNIRF